jgi:uncharacterized protein (DUF1499 family)
MNRETEDNSATTTKKLVQKNLFHEIGLHPVSVFWTSTCSVSVRSIILADCSVKPLLSNYFSHGFQNSVHSVYCLLTANSVSIAIDHVGIVVRSRVNRQIVNGCAEYCRQL